MPMSLNPAASTLRLPTITASFNAPATSPESDPATNRARRPKTTTKTEPINDPHNPPEKAPVFPPCLHAITAIAVAGDELVGVLAAPDNRKLLHAKTRLPKFLTAISPSAPA